MKMTAPGRLATLCLLTTVFVAGCCSEEGGPEWECLTIDSKPTTTIIRDYEYDRFRFFDIGVTGETELLALGDSIREFALFRSTDSTWTYLPHMRAYYNWEDREGSGSIGGLFQQIGSDYWTQYVLFREGHWLLFPRGLPQVTSTALAYFMVVRKADGAVDTVGSVDGDTLHLQLLKTYNPTPADPLWDAEWKNVYDLGRSEIVYDSLDVDIFRSAVGDESNPANPNAESGMPHLQLFLLDCFSTDGRPIPDGKIDDNLAILDLDNGLMVFPWRFPFADSRLAEPVAEIYSATTEEERQAASKYYLKVITNQRSKSVRLGRVNIIEFSEEITLDGVRLSRGVDYDIDYDLGTVTFRNDGVLNPDASLIICYEYGRCCP